MRKTESLLKAAGLLDEESMSHDGFPDGEGNQLDSDSEHENEQDNEGIQGPSNWEGDRMDSSNQYLSPSLGPNDEHARYERRRSSPDSSNLQHLPVMKMDGREESRYYGLLNRNLWLCGIADWLDYQGDLLPCPYYPGME